jgi:hypothetical protein
MVKTGFKKHQQHSDSGFKIGLKLHISMDLKKRVSWGTLICFIPSDNTCTIVHCRVWNKLDSVNKLNKKFVLSTMRLTGLTVQRRLRKPSYNLTESVGRVLRCACAIGNFAKESELLLNRAGLALYFCFLYFCARTEKRELVYLL